MDNLIFCLNATVPVFLMMLLGFIFRRVGFVDKAFADKINGFVFKAALPVLLFQDMSGADFFAQWDGGFVGLCFGVTAVSILAMILLSHVLSRELRGEFVQASYRSSVALLGAAFLENLYGSAGAASLIIIGAVPLYNAAAVTVLSLTSPTQKGLSKGAAKKVAKGIITNPIILGIIVGLAWTLLRIPQPTILTKTVNSISATGTPLGLMALGASFDWKKAIGRIKPALSATALKLVVFVAIFLPIAAAMGFRDDKLVAALTMLGSPTTVSCFVMARNMGHEGTLTSSTVMLTTGFSAFTLTLWLYVLKTLALI